MKPIEYETNEQGCHLVTSHGKDKHGYVKVTRNNKQVRLHRYVYEQHYGPIPEGLVIRHTCDNRSCINIEHLEVGTQQDNMNDMVNRGRHRSPDEFGENNGNSKLTEEVVIQILQDKVSTNKALGKKFGVHHSTISAIRKRKIWSHIDLAAVAQ